MAAKINALTKFHENWAKNVTSRKNAPPTGCHVFSPIQTIVKLVQDINKTNVLTNFHDDWTKIVTSSPNRENCHYIHIEKNAPPTDGHPNKENCSAHWRPCFFQQIGTTFELNQDIIRTNILTNFELGRDFIWAKLLTKFHEDGTRNVASRVFTSKSKIMPAPWRPCFFSVWNHFQTQLRYHYNKNNVLNKFHEDETVNVTSKSTNLLTKFHEDWK
ncbi:hypothetical protein DPMN_118653 [Dreissena polymorpha]|uniref:Uncharacterized protein n=1 Tax=Dreissena polymorpha TaxID=45954 RepID=A0A9D4GKJ4_DREPO|nr:hypothetical protein DPMN_118653 [Dreissena polymorpha]